MNTGKFGAYVFFGPANVGKSTIIGYLQTRHLSEEQFAVEVNKLKTKLGDKFKPNSLFSYFVDDHYDEYTKSTERNELLSENTNSHGTSKYVHIRKYGDFFLIDTPGGVDYVKERYRGLALADVGIFAIEIKQLLNKDSYHFADWNNFFISWYIWKRLHGINNTLVLLTKQDLNPRKEEYEKAKEKLLEIINEDANSVNIVPTSIDVKGRSDINVTKNNSEWYQGKCLVDLLKAKMRNNEINTSDSLFMFYSKKIFVEGLGDTYMWKNNQGVLSLQDRVAISPVKIGDKWGTVTASIKSMTDESNTNIEKVYPGKIANIVFAKYLDENGNSLSKKEIEIWKTAIITYYKNSNIISGNNIDITLESTSNMLPAEKDFLQQISDRREVSFLWFGNVIRALISQKENSYVEHKMSLRLPNDYISCLTDDLPKTIIMQISTKNNSGILILHSYRCKLSRIY